VKKKGLVFRGQKNREKGKARKLAPRNDEQKETRGTRKRDIRFTLEENGIKMRRADSKHWCFGGWNRQLVKRVNLQKTFAGKRGKERKDLH